METREGLTVQLQSLKDRIRELKNRLPAHSIKPGMMMELMELEDERDLILSRIGQIESGE